MDLSGGVELERTSLNEYFFNLLSPNTYFRPKEHWFSTYRRYEMANIIKVKLKTKKSWVRLLRNFILIGDKVWTNDRFNPSSSYWHSGTQFCVMRVVVVIGISGLYTPKKNRIQQNGNQIRFLVWRVKTRTEPLTQTSSGHISLSLIKVSAGEIKRVFKIKGSKPTVNSRVMRQKPLEGYLEWRPPCAA